MADYKKIDLQIGTEEQFEEKKLSLPVGTLVGITDPIHESELDTDLQTKINEVNNRLTKPTNPSAESAVTMLADGTVGTKPLTSITGKSEVYVGTPDPTGGEILWIDPNGTSGGGGSGGGKLYLHYIIKPTGDAHVYFSLWSSSVDELTTIDKLFEYYQVPQYQNRLIPCSCGGVSTNKIGVLILDYTMGVSKTATITYTDSVGVKTETISENNLTDIVIEV